MYSVYLQTLVTFKLRNSVTCLKLETKAFNKNFNNFRDAVNGSRDKSSLGINPFHVLVVFRWVSESYLSFWSILRSKREIYDSLLCSVSLVSVF